MRQVCLLMALAVLTSASAISQNRTFTGINGAPSDLTAMRGSGLVVGANGIMEENLSARFASAFPGANAGAKIQACINDLPTTGGTCDARGLEGAQVLTAPITISKPVRLQFGAITLSGTINSPDCLIEVTSGDGTSILGIGQEITALEQHGTGCGISSANDVELVNQRIADFRLSGNSVGSKGIYTKNWKDSYIERMTVVLWLDHGIDIAGDFNLNNVVRGGRIVAGVGAKKDGRAINYRTGGGALRIEDIYFNVGGTVTTRAVIDASNTAPIRITTGTNHGLVTGDLATLDGVLGNTAADGEWTVTRLSDTVFSLDGSTGTGAYTSGGTVYWSDRYSTAIDTRGGTMVLLSGNLYDSVVHCVQTSAVVTAINERPDFSTGGPIVVPGTTEQSIFYAYRRANNRLTVIGDDRSIFSRSLFNPRHDVSDKSLTYYTNNGQNAALQPGTLGGGVISPPQITGNVNNYEPNDAVAPTNLLGRYSLVWKLSTDTERNITGIAGGFDGKLLILLNEGDHNIILKHASASSIAANRIQSPTGRDWVIPGAPRFHVTLLVYDENGSPGGWRIISDVPTSLGGETAWDPANLPATGDADHITFTVTGAEVGDPVIAGLSTLGVAGNVIISAFVESANTVRVIVMNETGGALNIAPGTLRVMVFKARS